MKKLIILFIILQSASIFSGIVLTPLKKIDRGYWFGDKQMAELVQFEKSYPRHSFTSFETCGTLKFIYDSNHFPNKEPKSIINAEVFNGFSSSGSKYILKEIQLKVRLNALTVPGNFSNINPYTCLMCFGRLIEVPEAALKNLPQVFDKYFPAKASPRDYGTIIIANCIKNGGLLKKLKSHKFKDYDLQFGVTFKLYQNWHLYIYIERKYDEKKFNGQIIYYRLSKHAGNNEFLIDLTK